MKSKTSEKNAAVRSIQCLILEVRGQKVILDHDLAALYGVPTKALNQALRRNAARFPEDFAFQLAPQEVAYLRSQIVTSKIGNRSPSATGSDGSMRSQFVTASKRNVRFLPCAFTEHGALMAANVLRSAKAAEMSVFIVRAFVQMRGALVSQYETAKRLDQIEKILLIHDQQLAEAFEKIRPLLLPPPDPPVRRIGFGVKESRGTYIPRRKRGAA